MLTTQPIPADYYDEAYYSGLNGKSNYKGGYSWARFAGLFTALSRLLLEMFPEATTFLDVGCATGLLVRALREVGAEAYGFDHSAYCIEHADPVAAPHIWEASCESVQLASAYDVVIASETLEHLTPEQLRLTLPYLADHTKQAFFATIPTPDMANQAAYRMARQEPSHVTLQPRQWWYEEFEYAGFKTTWAHKLAEKWCHEQPLVRQMGWSIFLLGVEA